MKIEDDVFYVSTEDWYTGESYTYNYAWFLPFGDISVNIYNPTSNFIDVDEMGWVYDEFELIELAELMEDGLVTKMSILDEGEDITLTKHPDLDDCLVPYKIKIKGVWGTWEEFCRIYKEAKKLQINENDIK